MLAPSLKPHLDAWLPANSKMRTEPAMSHYFIKTHSEFRTTEVQRVWNMEMSHAHEPMEHNAMYDSKNNKRKCVFQRYFKYLGDLAGQVKTNEWCGGSDCAVHHAAAHHRCARRAKILLAQSSVLPSETITKLLIPRRRISLRCSSDTRNNQKSQKIDAFLAKNLGFLSLLRSRFLRSPLSSLPTHAPASGLHLI